MKKIALALALGTSAFALTACQDDAVVANHNLDKAADNFEIARSVSFYNTWTDTVVLQIAGLCSVKDETTKFQVTCKEPDGTFTRRQMGRSANLTYYMDQVQGVDVSVFHSRVTFKPQSLIPDIDFRGSVEELTVNHSEANG